MRIKNLLFILEGLFVLSLSLHLSSCKEEPVKIPPVPADLLESGSFMEGSQWIYANSNFPFLDTFTVYGNAQTEFKQNPDVGNQKSIETGVRRSLANDSFFIIINSNQEWGYLEGPYNLDEFSPTSPFLKTNPRIGQSRDASGEAARIVTIDTIYDTLDVSGFVFRNVVTYSTSVNNAFNKDATVLYVAPRVGIVRIDYPREGQTWELIDTNNIRQVIRN